MRPVVLALSVALLCCALGATALAAGPGAVEPTGQAATDPLDADPAPDRLVPQLAADADNTTSRLEPGEPTTHAYTEPTPDMTTALRTADDELRHEWLVHGVEDDWESLSDAERADALAALNESLTERAGRLAERERAATAAAGRGDASAESLLRTLVRTDREARALAERFQTLRDRAEQVPDVSVNTRPVLSTLDVHEGPVRADVAEVVTGIRTQATGGPVLVEASETGSVLSTVEGARYVREAIRYDNRDASRENGLTDRDAVTERTESHYPWAYGPGFLGEGTLSEHYSIGLFWIEVYHEQGELRAYVDGGTEAVFRENQQLQLPSLPAAPVADGPWTNGSLSVSVNATPRGGPVEVTATDALTGEPVDATLSVDDEPVTETGPDGTVWLHRPAGSLELVVEDGDRAVTVPIE